MRILILSDTFPPDVTGGAARVAFTQSRALQRLGHTVRVLSTRRDGSTPANVEVDGIHVHRIRVDYPLRWQAYLSLYNPAAARQVSDFLSADRPDVVHAHNIHAYLTYHSLRQLHRSGCPVVLTIHDTMTVTYQKFDEFIDPAQLKANPEPDYRVTALSQLRRQRFRYFPLRNALIRLAIANNVDALISPSREMLKFLAANGVAARRMFHVPNGIEPSEFETTPDEQAAFRREHDLVGRQVMLLAGRINQAKGGLQMIRALPRIVEAVPTAILLVLSPPGAYGEGLMSIAESQGIGQYIRFAGWLSGQKLAAAFGAADVLVTPSVYFDNFPTVNLEAMAAGTPVVATCFGGSQEAVLDGETGFIVNPYDLEALAERVSRLLADDALRSTMGQRARAHVQAHYDWLAQAARLAEIYEQVSRS